MAWTVTGNIRGPAGPISPAPFTAAVGAWQQPSNFVLGGAITPVTAVITACPLDVGPETVVYNGLAINVSTAAVGGTSPGMRVGIYADDGSGGKPGALLLDSGADLTVTTAGNVTISISQTLAPGRYWLGARYYYAAAPTTALQVTGLTSVVSLGGGSMGGSAYRGWTVSGQSSGALPNPFPTGASTTTGNVVLVGAKVASMTATATNVVAANITPYRSVTAAYTTTLADSVIFANGTFTVTLVTPVGNGGLTQYVRNTGTGTITVATAAGTINGSSTLTVGAGSAAEIASDGSVWWLI